MATNNGRAIIGQEEDGSVIDNNPGAAPSPAAGALMTRPPRQGNNQSSDTVDGLAEEDKSRNILREIELSSLTFYFGASPTLLFWAYTGSIFIEAEFFRA